MFAKTADMVAVHSLLAGILTGFVKVTPIEDPAEVYAGDVTYKCSNGWQLIIFNDCGGWDYVDHLVTPEGEKIDWDDEEIGEFIHRDMSNMLLEEPWASKILGSPYKLSTD